MKRIVVFLMLVATGMLAVPTVGGAAASAATGGVAINCTTIIPVFPGAGAAPDCTGPAAGAVTGLTTAHNPLVWVSAPIVAGGTIVATVPTYTEPLAGCPPLYPGVHPAVDPTLQPLYDTHVRGHAVPLIGTASGGVTVTGVVLAGNPGTLGPADLTATYAWIRVGATAVVILSGVAIVGNPVGTVSLGVGVADLTPLPGGGNCLTPAATTVVVTGGALAVNAG